MPNIDLISANTYTVAELTEIYNQTRIDYIVPMPMNAVRLQEYIDNYDLDLSLSVVAQSRGNPIGLAMLGVRENHTWITRLGVMPGKRHMGAGEALMRNLINQSWNLGVEHILLEVIINNVPAHRLFSKLGFKETRELLILRRPPGIPADTSMPYQMTVVDDFEHVLQILHSRRSIPSWLDEYPSLANAGQMHAIQIETHHGSSGWLAYQQSIFQLGRIVVQTEKGDPYLVGSALIHALHSSYPLKDTKTENLPRKDPHLQAFLDMKYLESFARIEMRLQRE